MAGYIKDVILSEESLSLARKYCQDHDWERVWQHYNLFHLDRIICSNALELEFVKELHTYSRKKHCFGAYFLKYIPGSFTRFHSDNKSELTIVTLIDSVDLVGGDTLTMAEYERPKGDRPSSQVCKRPPEEDVTPPYGRHIVPDVIDIKTGESMVYGPKLQHGVSKVYNGERTVLITWFKSKED